MTEYYGLFAYFFQVPRRLGPNNTEHDYYILEVGRCPKLIPIGCYTQGVVAGTELSYQKVLRSEYIDHATYDTWRFLEMTTALYMELSPTLVSVVRFNNAEYFPAPCQVFQGAYEPVASNENVALNTAATLSVSGLSALRFTAEEPCYQGCKRTSPPTSSPSLDTLFIVSFFHLSSRQMPRR